VDLSFFPQAAGERWIHPSAYYIVHIAACMLRPTENGGSIILCTIILAISTGCWGAVDPSYCILYCAYCFLYVKTNGEWWIYPSLHYNIGSFHWLLESDGSILPLGNGGSILLCIIILAISTGCWGAVDPFSCLLYLTHCCLYALWPM
jgi:hypothetical protein